LRADQGMKVLEQRTVCLGFAGLVLTYVFGYLAWYSGTPLGRVPVLDEREVLALAAQIATGDLPPEAFYRAPLYPAILALPLVFGVDPAALPLLARLANGLCHLASTYLVWQIAGLLWRRRDAQFLAGMLVGFNPVLLHFSGDALDITPAITALLLGVRAMVVATQTRRTARWLPCGLWLGVGVLLRPHVLPVLCFAPVFAWYTHRTDVPWRAACACVLPGLACLLALGAVNFALAGDFRILPWQGAYNFWVANRPGANGRYFEQQIPIHSMDERANTARLESEILYRREQAGAPADYRTMSRYWQARAWHAIVVDPIGWARRLARKAFYLVNDVEQYNNKTFAFHKARSPWLHWNPLGWAVVAILAALGIGPALRRAGGVALAWVAVVYAAGVLLYFVSDRFRAPLVPLLAIIAGGAPLALAGVSARRRALLRGLAVGTVALWPIAAEDRTRTYIQDYMAIARAENALGEHTAAAADAARALALDRDRPAALALLCVTGFNAWLHESDADSTRQAIDAWPASCRRAMPWSPTAERIVGYLEWRDGEVASARARWARLARTNSEETADARAWLLLTGGIPDDLAPADADRDTMLMLLARAWLGDGAARRVLEARMPPARLAREFAALMRLFGAARVPRGSARAVGGEGTGDQ
jgi:hypothetical protein